MQYINSVYCKRYIESDIITYSRINSTFYKIHVDSEACVDNKILFARGKKQSNNIFVDYLDEIKYYISVRRYTNISGLRCIIHDDTRRCLRSYLKELSMFVSMEFSPWTYEF